MKKRTFDEAISYFNQTVADMDIDRKSKMKLLGLITAVVQAHEEAQCKTGKWIGYKADDKDWQRNDGSPIFLICDQCKNQVINNGSATWNFCPSCGSYNGGEQE